MPAGPIIGEGLVAAAFRWQSCGVNHALGQRAAMTRTTVAILILLAVGLGGYLYTTAPERAPNAGAQESGAAEGEGDAGAGTAAPSD